MYMQAFDIVAYRTSIVWYLVRDGQWTVVKLWKISSLATPQKRNQVGYAISPWKSRGQRSPQFNHWQWKIRRCSALRSAAGYYGMQAAFDSVANLIHILNNDRVVECDQLHELFPQQMTRPAMVEFSSKEYLILSIKPRKQNPEYSLNPRPPETRNYSALIDIYWRTLHGSEFSKKTMHAVHCSSSWKTAVKTHALVAAAAPSGAVLGRSHFAAPTIHFEFCSRTLEFP